jgi:hypothetical protein
MKSLMNVLMIRYGLECTIHLKRRQNQKIENMIYIRQRSMPLLRAIVKPHMHPSTKAALQISSRRLV